MENIPRRNLTVAEALDIVRAGALVAESETVTLKKALGRVLAETVAADRDQPPFRNSAMDGYAVRRADLGPAAMTIVGESAAGRRYDGVVGAGETVRIFTGAPVPDECDAVVIQENTERNDRRMTVLPDGLAAVPNHIRPAGGDFRAGDILLEAGVRLDPWRLSLAASAGRDTLEVARRPRIAILSTGDELVAPGDDPEPDQIYESTSSALGALIKTWGGKAHVLDREGDSEKAIAGAVKDAEADLILTIGGASVGDYDLVKPALGRLGLTLEFESLNLRPGKPTAFGRLADGRRTLSLPGNPASAFVVAQLFLKPWIEASLGQPAKSPFVKARLAQPAPPAGPRESFLRARLSVSETGQLEAVPMADQDSSLVSIFAKADALLRLTSSAPASPAGEFVDVIPLDRL